MFLQAIPGPAAPLIVNGDFEDTGPASLPVLGWDPTGYAVINGGSGGNTGTNVLLLTPGSGAQQTGIATVSAQTYLLELFFASQLATPTVSWNGVSLGTPLLSFVSTTNANFTGNQYLVVGGVGTGTLRFDNPSQGNVLIDTVSLVPDPPVPVPELDPKGGGTALAFLGLSLFLLHDLRRRVAHSPAGE